jgi:hypothetical protein
MGLAAFAIIKRHNFYNACPLLGLGTFVYEQGDDAWESVTRFFGCCMDLPESMRRDAQLEDQGWVANLVQKGDPNEMEYQIAIGDGDIILAVTYILVNSPTFVWWPENLDDDCGRLELVMKCRISPDYSSHLKPG